MTRVARATTAGKQVVAIVRREQVTFMGAAIAYYAFFSLVPLLLLALVVAGTVGGEELADRVVEASSTVLAPEAQQLMRDALTNGAGQGGATVVGTLLLAWSGLKVFRALDKGFSTVYGTVEEASLVGDIRDGVLALVAVGAGVGAVTVAGGAIATLDVPLVGLLAPLSLLATLTAAFFPLYYVFPDVPITPRQALPGALFAAAGWSVLGSVFGFYTANAGGFALYGVLGVALLVLTWLYVGGVLLLVGAVLNVVLADGDRDDAETAGRGADRQLQHPGARQVSATGPMTDDEDAERAGSGSGSDEATGDADAAAGTRPSAETAELREEIERLREELDEFEDDVESRTVDRDDVESDLKRYVRRRVRRGHARGWGPYLVLLYGTAMTIGAFYTPYLGGGWAILAMVVIWLSTLGLYTLMVLTGTAFTVLGLPGRLRDAVQDWRS